MDDNVVEEIDCSATEEIVCPHCGYQFSDSHEYEINCGYSSIDCDNCGELFKVEVDYRVTYTTWK